MNLHPDTIHGGAALLVLLCPALEDGKDLSYRWIPPGVVAIIVMPLLVLFCPRGNDIFLITLSLAFILILGLVHKLRASMFGEGDIPVLGLLFFLIPWNRFIGVLLGACCGGIAILMIFGAVDDAGNPRPLPFVSLLWLGLLAQEVFRWCGR